MIFPPESVHEFRTELANKMNAGSIDDAEAFRQALAVDPHDPAALRFLALSAEEEGDRPLAVKRLLRAVEGGWWVERDNPAEGVDSWLVGAIPDADVLGVVRARLWPRPRRRPRRPDR